MISFFIEHHISVMVSYDGAEDLQNKYRPLVNGGPSAKIVEKNIVELSNKIPLQARMTITEDHRRKNRIRNMVDDIKKYNVNNIAMSAVDCTKAGKRNYVLNKRDFRYLRKTVEMLSDKAFHVGSSENRKSIKTPHLNIIEDILKGRSNSRLRCGAFYGMIAVATDGGLFPCHRFIGMNKFKIGDVFNGVQGDRAVALMNMFFEARKDQGEGCWLASLCGGTCYYHIANCDGSANRPSNEICESQKTYYVTGMAYFALLTWSPGSQRLSQGSWGMLTDSGTFNIS